MTEYDPGIRQQTSIFVRVPVIFARAAFYFFSYSNSPRTVLVSHSSSNNRGTVEDDFFLFCGDEDRFDSLIFNARGFQWLSGNAVGKIFIRIYIYLVSGKIQL